MEVPDLSEVKGKQPRMLTRSASQYGSVTNLAALTESQDVADVLEWLQEADVIISDLNGAYRATREKVDVAVERAAVMARDLMPKLEKEYAELMSQGLASERDIEVELERTEVPWVQLQPSRQDAEDAHQQYQEAKAKAEVKSDSVASRISALSMLAKKVDRMDLEVAALRSSARDVESYSRLTAEVEESYSHREARNASAEACVSPAEEAAAAFDIAKAYLTSCKALAVRYEGAARGRLGQLRALPDGERVASAKAAARRKEQVRFEQADDALREACRELATLEDQVAGEVGTHHALRDDVSSLAAEINNRAAAMQSQAVLLSSKQRHDLALDQLVVPVAAFPPALAEKITAADAECNAAMSTYAEHLARRAAPVEAIGASEGNGAKAVEWSSPAELDARLATMGEATELTKAASAALSNTVLPASKRRNALFRTRIGELSGIATRYPYPGIDFLSFLK
jgi:hypothetical protein